MAPRSTRRTILKIEQLSLLATVVIAFAAVAALVLTGQAGIRQDLRTSHATLLAGQVELRGDIKAVETGLRKEIKSVKTELRKEIKSVETELRKEIKSVETELRKEIKSVETELRKEIKAVETELREEIKSAEAGLRKDMQAGQAGLRHDLRTVETELRAGQAGIRKDLKSVEVRLAVVEQRTAGLSGESDASAAEPAPAAAPGERHHSSRAILLLARAVTAPFEAWSTGGPPY